MKKIIKMITTWEFKSKVKFIIYYVLLASIWLSLFLIVLGFLNQFKEVLPIFTEVLKEATKSQMSPEIKLIVLIIGMWFMFWLLKISGFFVLSILEQLKKPIKELHKSKKKEGKP